VNEYAHHNIDISDISNTLEGPDWRRIKRLDRKKKPGLSEAELLTLIAKCGCCNLVMARNVFEFHHCDDSDGDTTECED
jgi:hypothetical protein